MKWGEAEVASKRRDRGTGKTGAKQGGSEEVWGKDSDGRKGSGCVLVSGVRVSVCCHISGEHQTFNLQKGQMSDAWERWIHGKEEIKSRVHGSGRHIHYRHEMICNL